MYGKFFQDDLYFLAYDPEKKESLLTYIENKVNITKFEDYEEIIKFKAFNMLSIEKSIKLN